MKLEYQAHLKMMLPNKSHILIMAQLISLYNEILLFAKRVELKMFFTCWEKILNNFPSFIAHCSKLPPKRSNHLPNLVGLCC